MLHRLILLLAASFALTGCITPPDSTPAEQEANADSVSDQIQEDGPIEPSGDDLVDDSSYEEASTSPFFME